MDSFSKCVFVRAGKHTSVHDVHPHSNVWIKKYPKCETHKFIMISGRRLMMMTGCTPPENITEDINQANKIFQH